VDTPHLLALSDRAAPVCVRLSNQVLDRYPSQNR
jgi:hypothetical protein